jgi:dTDP-4-dehydrorhamnose reductase
VLSAELSPGRSRRILVTGASGLLGANLCWHLLAEGFGVVAQHCTHPIRIPGAESVSCDLTVSSSTEALISSVNPDAIVHSAALTNVDLCEDQPGLAQAVNVQTTRDLAGAAGRRGLRFILISTDSVFDGIAGGYVETNRTGPLNVYAKTKLEAEQAASAVCPSSLILRTNIYGWNAQAKTSLAEWILDRAMQSSPIPGFVDVVYTPILVNDLSDAIAGMLRLSDAAWLPGVYHAGGAEVLSKFEFARCLCEVFSLNPGLVEPAELDSSRLKAARPRNTSLCSRKATEYLGVQLPGIHAGLERFRSLKESGFATALSSWIV